MTKLSGTLTDPKEDSRPTTEDPPKAPAPVAATPISRDEIRAAILNSKPKSSPVYAFGYNLEVRQPPVDVVLGLPTGDENRARSMAIMLTNYVFMAGTDQKVFEPEDADALTKIPFSEDLQKISEAINSLTGVGKTAVDAAAKN